MNNVQAFQLRSEIALALHYTNLLSFKEIAMVLRLDSAEQARRLVARGKRQEGAWFVIPPDVRFSVLEALQSVVDAGKSGSHV